jgi:NtrC-family two-component system response regulator AlgB
VTTSVEHPPVVGGSAILLVDADDCFRRAMAISLRLDGFQVLEAANGAEALDQVRDRAVVLAVVDLFIGTERGDDVLEALSRACPHARLASMGLRPGMSSAFAQQGRAVHLQKPVQPQDIIRLL